MTVSDVDICVRALALISKPEIQSLDEGSGSANICKSLYPGVKSAVLASYPWRFTLKKRQLAREEATPDTGWNYQFKLPSDRISGPRAVYDSAGARANTITSYEVFGEYILADVEEIHIDYQRDVTEGQWPPYIQELIATAMAATICVPLTEQKTRAKDLKQEAFGTPSENGRGGLMGMAMSLDSAQSPPMSIFQNGPGALVTVRRC